MTTQRGFHTFPEQHGLLLDISQSEAPTSVSSWCDAPLHLEEGSTHYGAVLHTAR
ncbi:MAG: hypothetical protein H6727_14720 [Myxococcales bacterium]|nr:hypothetical protein [Myxococcales bacterium]